MTPPDSPLDAPISTESHTSDSIENNGAPKSSKATKLLPLDAFPEESTDSQEPDPEELARLDAKYWAEGENATTRFLRALFCLLSGTYLLWAQKTAPISTGVQWNRWIALSLVANFLIPLGIVWLFFAQGLRFYDYHKYLPDQKLAAWRYGWKWQPFARHLKISLLMFAVMLPILWWASRDEGTRAFYRAYFPTVSDAPSWAWLLFTVTVYMACWEWFFRGFLLFGLAQGTGAAIAIVGQAILFGWSHGGKPGLEMYSSFAGGLILGVVAWREKSFVPAFLTHAFIHIAWTLLILKF